MNIEKRNGQLRKNCVRMLSKLAEESGTDLSPFFFFFLSFVVVSPVSRTCSQDSYPSEVSVTFQHKLFNHTK